MRIVFLWALLGIGLFSACKRKAQLLAQATTPEQKTDSLCRPSKETVLQAVLLPDSLVQKLTPRYQYCEGKFKCVFQNKDQRLPFTLHFKTTRGQQTTFTLTAAFGLPVAAGWVRADSLYFHNKLDGSRIKEPLDLVYQYTGLPPDLGLLEGVLSGQYSMPRGFVATQVQDTMLVAYPLPNQTYRLQYQYAYKMMLDFII